jgi:hypothetical protein
MLVGVDQQEIDETLGGQAGVISRRQVLAAGGTDVDVERLLRRRVWARVHDGVYVDHTGSLTWEQRAWAAVLVHWPACLAGASALRAHRVRPWATLDEPAIGIVITAARRVDRVPGVTVRRSRGYASETQPALSPPRQRVETAVLVVASGARTEVARIAALADACQSRHTTAARLATALRSMPRLTHRATMLAVLEDVAAGTNSVLEHRFLTDVERAHGLPPARRQRRVAGVFTDAVYDEYGVVVELDGRLGHEWAAERWDDLDRDIASAERGEVTTRLGWRQVLEPCRVAGSLGRILAARGWPAAAADCGAGCAPVSRAA